MAHIVNEVDDTVITEVGGGDIIVPNPFPPLQQEDRGTREYVAGGVVIGGRKRSEVPSGKNKSPSFTRLITRTLSRKTDSKDWGEVLLYLSIHPAIAHVSERIGWQKLDSVDYYGLVLTDWSGAFKRTSTMGIPGTKARIMMLYLWSLAVGLPKEEQGNAIARLVSDAVSQGMYLSSEELTGMEVGEQVLRYTGVIEELAKELRSELPEKLLQIFNKPAVPILQELHYDDQISPKNQFNVEDVNHLISLLKADPSKQPKLFIPKDEKSARTLIWFTEVFHLGCRTGTKDESEYFFTAKLGDVHQGPLESPNSNPSNAKILVKSCLPMLMKTKFLPMSTGSQVLVDHLPMLPVGARINRYPPVAIEIVRSLL